MVFHRCVKKILLITFEYPTGRNYCGGVGQIVKQSREALVELGYEVYVLISDQFQKKYPVQLIGPDDSISDYESFSEFQKEHHFRGFDFIIQHFVNWTRDLRALKGRKGKRPKIIYHFHSILRREKESGFKTFNKFLLNQEKMIEIADQIICPSKYEYDNFNRYFPYYSDKMELLENTFEVFSLKEDTVNDIREKYGIQAKDTVSIYIGRLERAKGAHTLIDNLPDILKKGRKHKMFVIGKPTDRKIYRNLMSIRKKHPKQLFYIKYLEKELLFQYYYLSHIYINTSLSESFSLSTYEGAYCRNALLLNNLPVFERFQGRALFFSNREHEGGSFIAQYNSLTRNRNLKERLSKRAGSTARRFMKERSLKKDLLKILNNQ